MHEIIFWEMCGKYTTITYRFDFRQPAQSDGDRHDLAISGGGAGGRKKNTGDLLSRRNLSSSRSSEFQKSS
jgi:hypothetical protein